MTGMQINALTVCVEYDDLLRVTAPRNCRHFNRLLVITAPQDQRTQAAVREMIDAGLPVEYLITDVFYDRGAAFNKGAAIERGFDVLGRRRGWLCVIDADVILPAKIDWVLEHPPGWKHYCSPGYLYGAHRRMVADLADVPGDADEWTRWPIQGDKELAGYFQLFHANDPHLAGRRPWYGTDWRHAGNCDSDFQARWPEDRRLRFAWEVLHVGEPHVNWFGRGRRDAMRAMYAARREHGLRGEKLTG